MNAGQDYLLIAEDDRDILKLLDATLTFKGYRVITAHNGKEALEVIQIKRPAIVITDIMMPMLDGFGLVHRLRINPETRDIPVVFITATFMTPEDKEFALEIGATRFIQKPVDLEKFLITIAELLEPGTSSAVQPLKEFNFYDGYRKRLEAKLERKNKQIAREEHLLGTDKDEGNQFLQVSLRHAITEREELKLLLEQIHKQLEKISKPEK
ncbi:MAG TPA: response regulator [Anaerolineales bacterium]|nr:response regulator [Anaerolineales bacterium]